MPSLRDEITKTFRRLSRRGRTMEASRAETILASDLREGRDFGSYRIVRRLGFGGMGQVYLAFDSRLGRYTALKFLNARLTSDPAMLNRLYQEARTASALNHPNILTIYEMGKADGEHFIASEYVEGVTLRMALNRKLIAPKTAIEIAMQAASALISAHGAGIVHRDLKASNIMIRPDGLVKVIDFGLAKLSEGQNAAAEDGGDQPGPRNTADGVAGTVDYMSPEQVRGDPIDLRTDLWSLGVVLYEMIAGKLPFDGDTESHVIVGILDHEAPRLEPAASLPRGVTKILDRALIKDRNKRYQSAHEMLSDFEALGVTKQRISGIRQFAVLVDSKQTAPAAVFVGVFAALASAFAIWWFPLHGRERTVGPTWFEPGPAEQVTFDGNVKTATLSPSGKYLAYTSRVGGQETLHIRNLSLKTEWQLPPYSESTFGLTFSPNSESLYYVLHDQRDWGRLFSVETQGSIPKMLLDDIDGPVTFSPNGKRFAFMRRSEEKRVSVEKIILSEVNDTGNQQELVQKKSTNIGRTLAWSEEHNQIAAFIFSTGLHSSLRASLFLYGPDGSSRSELLSDTTIRSMGSPTWISGSNIVAFMGVTPWRTNNEAALYEAWMGGKTFRTFPSPALAIDSLSSPRDGNILAAIRRTRKASFWVAGKAALGAPREIVPEGDVDTGSFDLFGWDGQDNLIFPSAQSHSIDLVRLSPSGKVDKLTAAQGCTEQAPVYAAAKSALVYTSNCATLGNAHNLWQMNMKTGRVLQLTGGSTRDQEPDVAKDGSWIVYTTWPSFVPTLWKLPLGGGTPQQISNLQPRHPAISPDGQKVLCQIRESYDGRLRYAVMSLASGVIEKEFWDLPISEVRVRWEPDGRGIDFLDGEANRIWRKPLPIGRSVPLTPKTADPITDFAWNADGNKLAFVAVHSDADVVLFHRKAVHQ